MLTGPEKTVDGFDMQVQIQSISTNTNISHTIPTIRRMKINLTMNYNKFYFSLVNHKVNWAYWLLLLYK